MHLNKSKNVSNSIFVSQLILRSWLLVLEWPNKNICLVRVNAKIILKSSLSSGCSICIICKNIKNRKELICSFALISPSTCNVLNMFTFTVISTTTTPTLQTTTTPCEANQHYNTCRCVPTCDQVKRGIACQENSTLQSDGSGNCCQCLPGYIIGHDGSCMKKEDCNCTTDKCQVGIFTIIL